MKMKKRKLKLKKAGKIFKIVAEELNKNINTQVIIHESIMLELPRNEKHKIRLEIAKDGKVEKWYILHKGKSFDTEEICQLGVRKLSNNFYQVVKLRGLKFGFSYLEEYVCDEHKAKKILVLSLQKR